MSDVSLLEAAFDFFRWRDESIYPGEGSRSWRKLVLRCVKHHINTITWTSSSWHGQRGQHVLHDLISASKSAYMFLGSYSCGSQILHVSHDARWSPRSKSAWPFPLEVGHVNCCALETVKWRYWVLKVIAEASQVWHEDGIVPFAPFISNPSIIQRWLENHLTLEQFRCHLRHIIAWVRVHGSNVFVVLLDSVKASVNAQPVTLGSPWHVIYPFSTCIKRKWNVLRGFCP